MKRFSLYVVAIVAIVVVGVLLMRSGESVAAESVAAESVATEGAKPKTDVERGERRLELPASVDSKTAVEMEIKCGDRVNYTALYDTERYASLWVAYVVSSDDMGDVKRPSSWSYNPQLSTSKQVNLCSRSYNDDYSRGHLIPNLHTTEEAILLTVAIIHQGCEDKVVGRGAYIHLVTRHMLAHLAITPVEGERA